MGREGGEGVDLHPRFDGKVYLYLGFKPKSHLLQMCVCLHK